MGVHDSQRTAPWGDWESLGIESAMWFKGGVGVYRLVAGDFAADQADLTASTGITGGATPKVNFARPSSSPGALFAGFWRNIKIPDFAVGRDQAQRLASWGGLNTPGEGMGDGGRRIALQVENVLSSVSTSQGVQTLGADLIGFASAAKYKGFGAIAQADEGFAAAGDDAEDALVCSNAFFGCSIATPSFPNLTPFGAASLTAFPDLSLPSDADSADPNDAPTFSPNGVCRIQTIFDLPNTIMPGTIVEVFFGALIPITGAGAAGIAVQWQYSNYRWLKGGPEFTYPANIGPSSSAQLLGPTATYPNAEYDQPYFDDQVEEP